MFLFSQQNEYCSKKIHTGDSLKFIKNKKDKGREEIRTYKYDYSQSEKYKQGNKKQQPGV